MRPFRCLVFLAFCSLLATPGLAVAAQQGVPLASVARVANLQYEWLAAQRAVQLSCPGLVLIIRPGDQLYEINDRVEVASSTPYYSANDIYVSRALASHIEALASQAWLAVSEAQNRARQAALEEESSVTPELHGTIVLQVKPLKGAEALLITGQAPPSAPIRITLLGTLSYALPNVLLSRHDITSGPDGTFQAVVPIGPDYFEGTYIHVLATSVPGVASASAQVTILPPNAGVRVPPEIVPGGIW